MEKKLDLNLGQTSRKTLEEAKRIEKQTNDYLKAHDAKIREDKELLEKKKLEDVNSKAGFSARSAYSRNKERVRLMENAINYNKKATTAVMVDLLSNLVERSLLIDEEEYSKLNPTYKHDIKETVVSLLKNADLESNITNKKTLKLMEFVARSIPDAKTGVYLKEEEIVDMVKKMSPKEIEDSLEELSHDVKDEVANLVSKEQGDVNQIQSEVDEIVAVSEAMKGQSQLEEVPAEQELGAGEVPAEEMSAEELPAEEVPAEEMSAEAVPAEEELAPEVMPEGEEEDEYAEYQQSLTPGNVQQKETNLEIGPDGTIRINVLRERFFREHPKSGVLESLALNEAVDMIKEGKPYNGNLAIANALMYVTVLETFSAAGLIKLDENELKRIARVPQVNEGFKEFMGSVGKGAKKGLDIMADGAKTLNKDVEKAAGDSKLAGALGKGAVGVSRAIVTPLAVGVGAVKGAVDHFKKK
jgi:hypothetical protein